MRGFALATLLVGGLATGQVHGHAMPNSRVELQTTESGLAAKVTIPLSEMEAALGARVALDDAGQAALRAYLQAHVAVVGADGRAWPMTVTRLEANRGDHPAIVASLGFAGGPDAATLRYDAVTHWIASHYVLVYFSGRPLTRLQLPTTTVPLPPHPAPMAR